MKVIIHFLSIPQ